MDPITELTMLKLTSSIFLSTNRDSKAAFCRIHRRGLHSAAAGASVGLDADLCDTKLSALCTTDDGG